MHTIRLNDHNWTCGLLYNGYSSKSCALGHLLLKLGVPSDAIKDRAIAPDTYPEWLRDELPASQSLIDLIYDICDTPVPTLANAIIALNDSMEEGLPPNFDGINALLKPHGFEFTWEEGGELPCAS